MTIEGASTKTLILLGLVMLSAAFVWATGFESSTYGEPAIINPAAMQGWMMGGGIIGFILAIVISFKPIWAPMLAPVYGVCEGLFLGGFTAIVETMYPTGGLPILAAGLTFGVLGGMLLAYRSGVVKVTEKFKAGMMAAMSGILVVYLISWIMSLFGATMPFIHESGLVGIGFSLFVVVVAALNLTLSFDVIEQGARSGAEKYMEWYGAFGLVVALIWLYVEILSLLMKLANRER